MNEQKKSVTERYTDAVAGIREVTGDLHGLAVAFGRVGNWDVSTELQSMANSLVRYSCDMQTAYETLSFEATAAAKANVGSLLSAVIAGAIRTPAKES